MSGIRVIVVGAKGSTPREVGAAMVVTEAGLTGTIGGGALEWQAMAEARAMLTNDPLTVDRSYPLGPALGQCCGGAVTLRFEPDDTLPTPQGAPLWIWGAGHVGQALARTIAPLPDFDVTLIDEPSRLVDLPGTTPLAAQDMPALVPHAPHAHHLIVTYSHDIDFALCQALLGRDCASIGLIGSATKWARFGKRLRQLGQSDAQISRIACPIGKPTLGKHPQAIAIGVAEALLQRVAHELGTG